MAATTNFPSLSVPAPEDTMEMSSPANLQYDDDIDLDFGDGDGDHDGGVQLLEDEQMLTDGEQTRPATATDDIMDDDVQGTEVVAPETDMQDTPEIEQQPAEQEDEELIDYGEDYFDHPQTEDAVVEDVTGVEDADHEQLEGDIEEVDEEIVRHSEDAAIEQPGTLAGSEQVVETASEEVAHDQAYAHDGSAYANETFFEGDENAVPDDHDQTLVADPESAEALAGYEFADADAQGAAGDAEALQPPLAVDTSLTANADGPTTPTDTGLHPMTVYYSGHAMPLFKSKHQPDGLLKDDNLASLSLAELMRNCRQRIALKIGNVPEEQELTLAFDHMGLLLAEVCDRAPAYYGNALTVHQNSRAAFEHSLNDVLEVYLQLHQNDDTHDVPALSLTLSHQQFSNQLALLQQAAAGGKGMSDFVQHTDGEDEYYEEDDGVTQNPEGELAHVEDEDEEEQYRKADEDYDGQEYTQDQEYRDEEANEQQDASALEEGERRHQQDETAEPTDNREVPEDAFETTYNDATGIAYDTATEAAVDASLEDVINTAAEEAANIPAEHAVAEEPTVLEEPNLSVDDTRQEALKAASTASSQTVQGDHANDSIGEYDPEDIIDWDEDSSLTSIASEHTADGHDESFTSLAESEVDQIKEGQESTVEQANRDSHLGDDVQQSTDAAENHDAANEQQQLFGSEDLLNDFDDEQYEGNAGGEQHQEDDEHGYTENNYDQADTFDEQQVGYQPGEEDEQYHTARDFLNGESYEHGPEHQPEGQDNAYEDADGHGDHQDSHKDDLYDFLDEDAYEQRPEAGYPAQGESPPDPEDDIGFDDDTTEQHEARKTSQPDVTAVSSGSPFGKRSFDEHAEADELNLDEPEMKKVRSE